MDTIYLKISSKDGFVKCIVLSKQSQGDDGDDDSYKDSDDDDDDDDDAGSGKKFPICFLQISPRSQK